MIDTDAYRNIPDSAKRDEPQLCGAIITLCDEIDRLRNAIYENVCERGTGYVNLTFSPELYDSLIDEDQRR